MRICKYRKDRKEKTGKKRLNKKVIFLALGVLTVFSIVAIWISNILPNKIANTIYNDLNSSQITYEEAKDKLNLLDKVGDVSWAYDKCDKLNNSQYSYRYAVELQGKKDYKTAVFEFDKVIQEDLNYENARKTIEEIRTLAYDDIVNTLNEYLKNENYVDAFKIIENAEKIFENDEKISSFKKDFSKIKERTEIEKEIEMCDLSTKEGIEHYVELKYASLKNTPFGDWNFIVKIHEFNNKSVSCDYSIVLFLEIDFDKIYEFKDSRDYLEVDRQKTEAMLKNHIQTLAKDLIEKLPNKKLVGEYEMLTNFRTDSGKYMSSNTDRYYEWTNYVYEINADYASSSPSGFRWKWTEPDAPWYYQTFFYGGAK